MAKLDLRHVCNVLQTQYIEGDRLLKDIAPELGCSAARLAQIGKEFVPGYREAADRRNPAVQGST